MKHGPTWHWWRWKISLRDRLALTALNLLLHVLDVLISTMWLWLALALWGALEWARR